MTEETRDKKSPSIWDVGEKIFGNRAYVTKLIKDFGEDKVVKAIAELDAMKNPPNDAKAYVVGMLRDDSVATQIPGLI